METQFDSRELDTTEGLLVRRHGAAGLIATNDEQVFECQKSHSCSHSGGDTKLCRQRQTTAGSVFDAAAQQHRTSSSSSSNKSPEMGDAPDRLEMSGIGVESITGRGGEETDVTGTLHAHRAITSPSARPAVPLHESLIVKGPLHPVLGAPANCLQLETAAQPIRLKIYISD